MTKDEFVSKYPWVDPTRGYPDNTLIAGVHSCNVHVAVRTGAAHKAIPFMQPVHSAHLERIDGHDWELFGAGLTDGVYMWGMFVEGLGMMNVMVPIEFTRPLLAAEREAWSKVTLGMYGSHTGKHSYNFPSGVQA